MWLDILVLALVAAFVIGGARRGAVAAGSGLLALMGAYAASLVAAAKLGSGFAHWLGLPPLLGPAVAGAAVGTLVFVALMIGGAFARRWDRERKGALARGGADRLLGGVLGGLRGAVLALLVALLAGWVDAARSLDPEGALSGAPRSADSRAARLTGAALEGGMRAALGDEPGARVLARVVAQPGRRIASVRTLLDDPRIQAVQEDRFFWTLVENGASERALNRLSFYRVSHDPGLRARFADLGFVSAEAADDPDRFRDELRGVLDAVGERIRGIRRDPQLQRLARDPEVLALLESGDTLGLLAHPGIRALAARLAEGTDAAGAAAPAGAPPARDARSSEG